MQNKTRRFFRALVAVCMMQNPAIASAASGGFDLLEPLNGGSFAEATGVSADGQIIVGTAQDGKTGVKKAVIWQLHDGRWVPAALSDALSSATGISATGDTVVGEVTGERGFAPFRWTLPEGLQRIGRAGGAASISADGRVVVGSRPETHILAGLLGSHLDAGSDGAFRWAATSGMAGLGNLKGSKNSHASAVSADGAFIVGYAAGGTLESLRAVVWRKNADPIPIERFFQQTQPKGMLPNDIYKAPLALSGSGEDIVVSGMWDQADRLFLWRKSAGLSVLPVPEGYHSASVSAISANGRLVVGEVDEGYARPHDLLARRESRAVCWEETGRVRFLVDWLAAYQVSLPPEVELRSARAVNHDGTVIVGQTRDDRAYRAWSTANSP